MQSAHAKTFCRRESLCAVQVEVIRLLVSNYFDIVRSNLADLVPKALMRFLVHHSQRGLQQHLIATLYRWVFRMLLPLYAHYSIWDASHPARHAAAPYSDILQVVVLCILLGWRWTVVHFGAPDADALPGAPQPARAAAALYCNTVQVRNLMECGALAAFDPSINQSHVYPAREEPKKGATPKPLW
jgi:hypothetical protein